MAKKVNIQRVSMKAHWDEFRHLKAQVASLTATLDVSLAERKALQSRLTEERSKHLVGLTDSIRVKQLEKTLRTIEHISAGRGHKAILEVLTPAPTWAATWSPTEAASFRITEGKWVGEPETK